MQKGAPEMQAAAPPPPDEGPATAVWEFLNNIARPLDSALDALLGPPEDPRLLAAAEHTELRRENKVRRRRRPAAGDGEKQRIPQMDLEHELQTQAQKVAEEYERERLAAEAEDAAHRLAQRANQQKIIQTTVAQVVGLYAVSQACMLTVFVPQKCPKRMPGSSLLFTYKTELPEGHLCTLQEVLDFSTRTLFGNVVYGFNVGTLVLMLAAQVYFWKREVWFIRHLQDDESAPYSNLATLLKSYPDIETDVTSYNNVGYGFAVAVTLSVFVNLILSSILLLYGDGVRQYNIGSRTTTGLVTNTLLVTSRVYGFMAYARLSYVNNWAISLFTVIPRSYNFVDEELLQTASQPDYPPTAAEM